MTGTKLHLGLMGWGCSQKTLENSLLILLILPWFSTKKSYCLLIMTVFSLLLKSCFSVFVLLMYLFCNLDGGVNIIQYSHSD